MYFELTGCCVSAWAVAVETAADSEDFYKELTSLLSRLRVTVTRVHWTKLKMLYTTCHAFQNKPPTRLYSQFFLIDLFCCSQGEKGEAGPEGATGERGEIGLKGKEGPPGPPGLVGVRVSVSSANSVFHSIPMNRRLFCPLTAPVQFFFPRVRRGNLAHTVKEENQDKRFVGSLARG